MGSHYRNYIQKQNLLSSSSNNTDFIPVFFSKLYWCVHTHINALYKIRNSFMGGCPVGEGETAGKVYKLTFNFWYISFSFQFWFFSKNIMGKADTCPSPPPPMDEGCLRIYCELNGRKHWQNLIISEHHHEDNFDILQSFTDIWNLSHFLRIYYLLGIIILFYILVTSHEHIFSFLCSFLDHPP